MVEWLESHSLAALLSALALGGMVFFSFLTAPLVFKTLAPETAAAFMAAIFPVYYRLLAALTAAAAVLAWPLAEAILLAAVGAAFVLLWLLLLPRIARHRAGRAQGDAAASAAFTRLHRLSVVVNLAQMVALVVVFMMLTT